MKLPRNFFKPLALGAPAPLRELPVRIERMIHFVPPHLEKLRARVPELIQQVDVVLGNLEDAIPADAKAAARAGFIAMAKANDFGSTGLWTRVNALNSPWLLSFGAGEWGNHAIHIKRTDGITAESYPWYPYFFGLLLDAIGIGLFGFGLYRLVASEP